MPRALLLGLCLALATLSAQGQTMPADPAPITATQAGLTAWIAAFRPRALQSGVTPEAFDRYMPGVSLRLDVLERDRRQDEFTKTIWDYLDKAVSDDRVASGQKALAQHKALLDKLEARYNVDRAAVVAIWGLESAFGAVRGDIPVLDAVATLSYDARRAPFFEAELIAALLILQDGQTTATAFLGSWAGASGHTQFMPTSIRATAESFDGQGLPDLWSDDPADALASTAAYLAKAGWKMGLNWGWEVALPPGFDLAQTGSRTPRPMAHWQALGLTLATGQPLPSGDWSALILPAGARGPAFLITDNFAAIEAYNRADAYVIAVGHLSDRLTGAPPLTHPWPRDLRALTLPERQDLQSRLKAAGLYAGEPDGKIGPLSLAAVKAFQQAAGLPPDSYASLPVLEALRRQQDPQIPPAE
jgi:membrane-bound lytic murein transglycosylase B